jgi:hypothetical protein
MSVRAHPMLEPQRTRNGRAVQRHRLEPQRNEIHDREIAHRHEIVAQSDQDGHFFAQQTRREDGFGCDHTFDDEEEGKEDDGESQRDDDLGVCPLQGVREGSGLEERTHGKILVEFHAEPCERRSDLVRNASRAHEGHAGNHADRQEEGDATPKIDSG